MRTFLLLFFFLSHCGRRYSHCQQLLPTWPNCVCLEKIVNSVMVRFFYRLCQTAVSVSVSFSFTVFTVLVSDQVFMVMIPCGDICKLQYTSTPPLALSCSLSPSRSGVGVSSSHFSCQACKIEWQWRKSKQSPNLCAGQGVHLWFWFALRAIRAGISRDYSRFFSAPKWRQSNQAALSIKNNLVFSRTAATRLVYLQGLSLLFLFPFGQMATQLGLYSAPFRAWSTTLNYSKRQSRNKQTNESPGKSLKCSRFHLKHPAKLRY